MFKNFPAKIYSLLIVTVLIYGCTGGGGNGQGCSYNYFVSTTGNDVSGDGSQANPFQTIDRARLAVQGNSVKAKTHTGN